MRGGAGFSKTLLIYGLEHAAMVHSFYNYIVYLVDGEIELLEQIVTSRDL